uniref:Gamma-tubulin complex component 3 isogeny n=1 Tax=Cajanus cajan TaxID=3821 RepID=A0A151TUA3_CAJCA|nr:Gamma-tubulin complex component 3 isogeny [Cajanus cajan]
MEEEEDQQKLPDLVKELVQRLLSQNLPPNSPPLNPNSPEFINSLRYAHRILSSRLTPSVAPDAAAIADSIKRRLAAHARSSEALSFADLFSKFAHKAQSVNNKWAVIYLLKIISEDRHHSHHQPPPLLPNLAFSQPATHHHKPWTNGALLISKDPDNRRDVAFRDFVAFVREENEVSEEALVRDVLYACQGVDGKFVKFESESKRYAVPDSVRVPRATRSIVHSLCELGVFEYYKLLAVLEAQSSNPIPLVSESATSGNYLSLRRLAVWLAEPMVKMRLMADLVEKCRVLRGGAILRTGKSINFLRVCCEDRGWADAATEVVDDKGAASRRGGFGYGETDTLEFLVDEAAKRIDKHLLDVIFKRYKFKEHCLAIKRYLLLGQGDFVQYLMDIVGPELSEPANTISSFKLSGLLETAIRASNAQYDDPDILDRLRVKMMPHESGDRGWDVFSLEYDARVPLDTVFTESVMARYLRIFNFLWKLRRVEHALTGTWKTMKPNCITSNSFTRLQHAVKMQLVSTLRRCQVLWVEINHFISNLQYYIMFEVLEVSWSNFVSEMEVAEDLDDLLAAHEKYLHSIVEKSLLGELSQSLSKSLFVIFDLILRFRSRADRLYEGIHELQARMTESSSSSRDQNKSRTRKQLTDKSAEQGSWIADGRKALTQRAGEFLRNMGQDLDAIAKEYSSLQEEFISQLPVQQHVDLKFLFFRLDFNEFYRRLCPSM